MRSKVFDQRSSYLYLGHNIFAWKIIWKEHIIKVYAAKLTFKILLHENHILTTNIIKGSWIMHISNYKNKKHTRNRSPILGSSSFLIFTTKDVLFYSLWSPSFSSEWIPSWFQWKCFDMEENIKKTLLFLSSICLTKFSLFSLLSFLLKMNSLVCN